MIEKQQQAEALSNDKATIEENIEYCRTAEIATGDWDSLLKREESELSELLSVRCTELASRGRIDDVAQVGAKHLELEPRTHGNLYNAACAYSLCAAILVNRGTTLSEAEEAERARFLELSRSSLKEAIAAGWTNFEWTRKDSDLVELRKLPDFEDLLVLPENP